MPIPFSTTFGTLSVGGATLDSRVRGNDGIVYFLYHPHWIPICIGMVGEGVLIHTTSTFVILDLIEDPGY